MNNEGKLPSISPELRALLTYSKLSDSKYTWREVANALSGICAYEMNFFDVVCILLGAYEEALGESRFEMNTDHATRLALMSSPINGKYSVENGGPTKGLDTSYTVEQFYNSIIGSLLGDLATAQVGWLNEPQPSRPGKLYEGAHRPVRPTSLN